MISAQTYSGFNRFKDNVKMVFSFGDKKVNLALDIREKEVDSAIENNKNENTEAATENLERAWKKLQVVQEKVSVNVAEEVKESSGEIMNRINNEESLSDNFDLYILEEEKTGLKAEWVIAIDGEEGQTETLEVVGDGTEGQTKVREIETKMGEVDVEIKEWVVDTFEKTVENDDGLTWVVANKIAKDDGDDGLTRDIKNYVDDDMCEGENCIDDDVAPGPQGIIGNQGDGGDGMAPGTSGTDTDDNTIDSGTIDSGDSGIEGPSDDTTTDDDSGSDSSDGDSSDSGDSEASGDSSSDDSGDSSSDSGESDSGDSLMTGDVIQNIKQESFFRKIFKKLSGSLVR